MNRGLEDHLEGTRPQNWVPDISSVNCRYRKTRTNECNPSTAWAWVLEPVTNATGNAPS